MEPLHLAMMRGVLQPCGPDLQVLRSSPSLESFEGRTHSSMGFNDCWGEHSRAVFRAFLALSDGSGFAHYSSSFNAKRSGDLHVDELVGILNARFGDAHVHSRTVFGIYGRAVHKDIDVCTYRVARSPWAHFVSQNSECVPFLPPFRSEWAPLAGPGGSKFLCESQISSSYLGLSSPFGEVKKFNVRAFEKPDKSRSGSTKNACCLIHLVSRICF